MTEVVQGMTYAGYAAAPPQGQQQQPVPYPATGPGYPAPPPTPAPRPKNIPGILGAIGGTIGLICGVVALIVTLTRPEPVAPTPAPVASQPFMFSPETDKQWCISMRSLRAESMDMTPASVIDNGPSGIEYQKFASWVKDWSERMSAALNKAADNGSKDGWLDRTARREVDLLVAVGAIKPDQWWTADTSWVFNDAAHTGTTINAYCRSIGEPVRP
ncbi:hypothetical protein [Mycobacterium sp. D16R24]|uniref:hypothetical protein n=1 Tax=Mycobacterium sp. D16R24 TaxID=1855656 RepID=UPI000991BD7A|nr:hypothetical protein [Mycobacterium sp. D16R24]